MINMHRKDELHSRIRNLRIEAGKTQKQVADVLGVEVSTYAHYEKGDRTPDAKKLAKLAELYELDDEMLGARFPIESFVSYDKKDIERLKYELDNCTWRKGDYYHNKQQYEILKDAVRPILRDRDEALSLPDIKPSQLVAGLNLAKVKLDLVGEALISRYFKETENYFNNL